MLGHEAHGLLGGHRGGRRKGEGGGGDRRPGIRGDPAAVEQAVAVAVDPVVGPVDLELGRAGGKWRTAVDRPLDEVVADRIGMRRHVDGVAHDVPGGLVAVDHVVDELVLATDLWIAGHVVGEQAFDDAEAAPLAERHQATGAVPQPIEALRDHGVLDRNVVDHLAAVRVHRERLVDAPRDRHVVEDHVRASGQAHGILTGARLALADGDVAADRVIGPIECESVAIHGESTRSSLAGDRHVAADNRDAVERHHPAHVKHHKPIRLAHRVSKRPGPGVVEVGDVVDRGAPEVRAGPGGETAEALSLGKGQRLTDNRRADRARRCNEHRE